MINTGKVLGGLETEVMEVVWQTGAPISVGEVVNALGQKQKVAHTTIMTIMGRLTEKGLLKRITPGKTYLYKPAYSRDTFLKKISRQIIKNLVVTFGDTVVAHFTEELEKVPFEKKQKLLKILKEAKNNERK